MAGPTKRKEDANLLSSREQRRMSYDAKREALEDHCTRERSKKYARKNNDTLLRKEQNHSTQSKTNDRAEVTDLTENDHPEIVTETDINTQASRDVSIVRGDASTLTSTSCTTLQSFPPWTREAWKRQQQEAGTEMQRLINKDGYIAITKFEHMNIATEIVKNVLRYRTHSGQSILQITPGMSMNEFVEVSMRRILTPRFNTLRHNIQTAMKKRYTGEERKSIRKYVTSIRRRT